MTAKLHIGNETFELPEGADYQEFAKRLGDAFGQNAATTVQVVQAGTTLLLIINPSQISFIGLDEHGTGMGFHSG